MKYFWIFLPLFSLSAWSCQSIRAAFDIGSGTTKMRVYKVNSCQTPTAQAVLTVQNLSCELRAKVPYKEDLKEEGIIQKSTITKGLHELSAMVSRAKRCGATEFIGVATSAFRQATNADLAIRVLEKSGVKIFKISQREEAKIGFHGALINSKSLHHEDLCVWDIGGSSMQIICNLEGKKKIFMSQLASIPFKMELMKIQGKKTHHKKIMSPNPISYDDLRQSYKIIEKEAKKAKSIFGKSLSKIKKFYGIGSVHYFSVSKVLDSKKFKASQIHHALKQKLSKTDVQLGGGPYVDTSVSNMILVEGMMRALGINSVESLKVNLTDGLAILPQYWQAGN